MKKILLFTSLAFILTFSCKTKEKVQVNEQKTQIKNYEFETVENDPTNTKIYTLTNGLKVYLSVNKDEPRIQTYIAVKAGSKFDPKETTGLAHYLEHMMFKGTHIIGTKDWKHEKVLLDKIAAKFEEHKNEKDEIKKTELYKEIDALSYEASKFAIANEYDKMVSSLGAKGTNAYTSNEKTVYVNNIPSNELEKFLKLEGERFKTLVLRLFHTELETVYEEFNRSQDSDGRWVYQKVLEGLFPNHPYGTQTTIGLGEHIKNPSMYNIRDYFQKYYRPNNVAICLSGDLDPNKTIALIEKSFGDWERNVIEDFIVPEYKPLEKVVVKETFGPQQEMVYMGYRFEGAGTKNALMLSMIDMILANSQAGLIDLDLNLAQKVLKAGSFPMILKDHSVHFLYGVPKQGQTLEEVKDLLLEEIEKVKNGEFDNWLVEAIINNLKLDRIKNIESNRGRANLMVDAFTNGISWENYIFQYERMEQISKNDIVEFAKNYYGNNYVVSYKRIGEPKRHSVPKPEITQLELDRESKSEFFKEFEKMKSPRLEPVFLNFEESITRSEVNSLKFSYVKNETNQLFSLSYIFDMGDEHSKEISLAVSYLPYLGTNKYSAEELQKEFYKYGLSFDVNTSSDRMYISLSGLEKNLEAGMELFEHILKNVEPDKKAYQDLVSGILKGRKDAKLNKDVILRKGLISMAKYGKESPFRNFISDKDLNNMDVSKLTAHLKSLTSYKHRIFYYGSRNIEYVNQILTKYHKVKIEKEIPEKIEFEENSFDKTIVYFTPYDMQQIELYMIAPDQKFNPQLMAVSMLFNEYFGAGLSSIVFQEIREKKALAYSAYAWYSNSREADKNNYLYAYLGTQHDKMENAVNTMLTLLNEMPEAELQFNGAKDAVLKKMESSRKTGESVYWAFESAKKRNLDYDVNKEVYEILKNMTITDLKDFFNNSIKGKKFSICVIGNPKDVDLEILKPLGEVKKLSLEEIFGY